VSIAVSFFTTTKRLAMVFLRDDIFSCLSSLLPATEGEALLVAVDASFSTGAGASALEDEAGAEAFTASSFVMRPSLPVPFIDLVSIPFSLRIFAAAGDAVPAA